MKRSNIVYGVGINDCVIDSQRIYLTWKEMLRRCYSKESLEKFPAYVGCSVSNEWHKLSIFSAWMASQDYGGKQLDKDILLPGNKVYSSETCVFVSRALNLFNTDRRVDRGEWPIGVYLDSRDRKFRALCRNPFNGKQEKLGSYIDPLEAHEAWREKKHEHACRYADMQTDPRIENALRTRYAKTTGEQK